MSYLVYLFIPKCSDYSFFFFKSMVLLLAFTLVFFKSLLVIFHLLFRWKVSKNYWRNSLLQKLIVRSTSDVLLILKKEFTFKSVLLCAIVRWSVTLLLFYFSILVLVAYDCISVSKEYLVIILNTLVEVVTHIKNSSEIQKTRDNILLQKYIDPYWTNEVL